MELKWSSVTKLIHETPEDYIPNVETGINFYLDGDDTNTSLSIYVLVRGYLLTSITNTNFKRQYQMGKIFGQAVFSKGVQKSIWNFSGYYEVKKQSL
jgi:hypothetical protein